MGLKNMNKKVVAFIVQVFFFIPFKLILLCFILNITIL